MEMNKQSSKALEETEMGNLKPNKEEEVLEKIGKNDEQIRGSSYSTVQKTSIGVAKESKDSEFEVLPSAQISESDVQSNFSFSSEHLSEVPVKYTLQPLVSDDELKDQVRVTLKEHLIGNTGQSAHVETHNQITLPDGPSKLSLSPTSVRESISPGPSSALQERKLSPTENGNNSCLAEQDRQNSSNPKLLSAPKPKTSADGYNWRKYGQKQVKSPEGSRSYYRCTFSDCHAKKIEFCDQFGNVIEIVYRDHHNHDPPQKVNCNRESRHALPVVPANGSDNAACPVNAINDSDMEKPVMEMAQLPETNRQDATNSDEIVEISTKEEHVNEVEHKKRQEKSVTSDMLTIAKPGKKPKTVVEEAGDVGISGDGYRWRKYGQKMVKGNVHPRNYYRCTSAGCPVRKHIERATDSSSAVIVSYTGEHDHDMPVPKKTRGPTSDSLVATASPGPMNNLQISETEV
ncbi:probable WRKY transcription factor 32 [Olea europaea var. sylvestris]|uniref:probable WRKY transcription factor 32 n=1 Tax=Olea europaea var. sylvestris TaxID=158386 RepID=UPI000C1D5614|nr:probable WRKY transcription factor 32 [Olea europaea var. sylvestris]